VFLSSYYPKIDRKYLKGSFLCCATVTGQNDHNMNCEENDKNISSETSIRTSINDLPAEV